MGRLVNRYQDYELYRDLDWRDWVKLEPPEFSRELGHIRELTERTAVRVESLSKWAVEGAKTPFIVDRPDGGELGEVAGLVRGLKTRLDAIEAKLESRTKGG